MNTEKQVWQVACSTHHCNILTYTVSHHGSVSEFRPRLSVSHAELHSLYRELKPLAIKGTFQYVGDQARSKEELLFCVWVVSLTPSLLSKEPGPLPLHGMGGRERTLVDTSNNVAHYEAYQIERLSTP